MFNLSVVKTLFLDLLCLYSMFLVCCEFPSRDEFILFYSILSLQVEAIGFLLPHQLQITLSCIVLINSCSKRSHDPSTKQSNHGCCRQ